jgi:hypothetical protein
LQCLALILEVFLLVSALFGLAVILVCIKSPKWSTLQVDSWFSIIPQEYLQTRKE